MQTLLSGSSSGVLRISPKSVQVEEGPTSVAYLAQGAEGTLALALDGALWGRDQAGRWRRVADRTIDDEPWSFAADPRLPGRLYIGVSPALLYRSDDDGQSWTACDSIRLIPGYETWTFPPPPHIPHVRSIAVDPDVIGGVYIGVEEGGVYHSPDGGETWQSLNDGLYWDVHTVAPALEGDELFATTGAGFHRSEDGGRNWRHVTNGLTNRYTVPLLVSRVNSGRLFTAAAGGPPPTWQQGVRGAIYRSDDSGQAWRKLEDGLPAPFSTMINVLIEDPEGCVYAAAGGELFSSENGGESWSRIAEGLPPVRSLVVA